VKTQQITLTILFSLLMASCTPPKNTLVIGHRGARGHLAENTLPSIAKALDLGVDGIEIDIFQCASGELVVFHDKTLDKLTNATGYIEALDLDSIQRIEVLNGFTIPTLNEVMDLVNGKVLLNIELKGSNTALKTHELLKSYFETTEWSPEKVLISSFDWEELKLFRKVNQEVPIAVLTEDDPLDALAIGLELNAIAINPNYRSLNSDVVSKIHQKGFEIYTWTVNEVDDINLIRNLGVEAIITDFPERVPKEMH